MRATNSTTVGIPFSSLKQSSFELKMRPASLFLSDPSGLRLILKPWALSRAVIFNCTLTPRFTRIGDGLYSYFFAEISMTLYFLVRLRSIRQPGEAGCKGKSAQQEERYNSKCVTQCYFLHETETNSLLCDLVVRARRVLVSAANYRAGIELLPALSAFQKSVF